MKKRAGGCNCGEVRFEAVGAPLRVGFCHCQTCRKETGSIGGGFAVWPATSTNITGETKSWRLSTDDRHFCFRCGSSLFSIVAGSGEVEFRLGAFDDAPTDLTPGCEVYAARREHWLAPIPHAAQNVGEKPPL